MGEVRVAERIALARAVVHLGRCMDSLVGSHALALRSSLCFVPLLQTAEAQLAQTRAEVSAAANVRYLEAELEER